MSVLQIPTDNLYKFIAITGLVLVVVSIIGWIHFQDASDQAYAKYRIDTQASDNVQAFIGTKVNTHDPTSVKNYLVLYNVVQSQYDQWAHNNINAFIQITAIQASIQRWMNFLSYAFQCGSAMIPIGFILWWWKVQRYQDIVLKNQAKTGSP